MKEVVAEFKRRMSIKVRRQKKLNIAEEKDFKRESYLGSIQQECYMNRIMGNSKRNT